MIKIIMAISLLLPSPALAADLPDRNVNPGDASGQMLGSLLGSVWSVVAGGTGGEIRYAMEEAVAAIIGSLNFCALAILSVYILYNFGLSAVITAQEGKVRAASSFWMPVRAALSFGLCAPVVSGYSLLQVAIMALAGFGINFADMAWDEARAYIVGIRPQAQATHLSPEAEAMAMVPPLFRSAVSLEIAERAGGGRKAEKSRGLVNGCLVVRDEHSGTETVSWPEKGSAKATFALTGNDGLDEAKRRAVTAMMADIRKAAAAHVAARGLVPGDAAKAQGMRSIIQDYAKAMDDAWKKAGKIGNSYMVAAIGGGEGAGMGWISAGLFSYGMAQTAEGERFMGAGGQAEFGTDPEGLSGILGAGRWWTGREQSGQEIQAYMDQAQRIMKDATGFAEASVDGRRSRATSQVSWRRYVSDIWKSLGGSEMFSDALSLFIDRDPVQAAAILGGRISDTGMLMISVAGDAHLTPSEIAARNPIGGIATVRIGLSLLKSPLYLPVSFTLFWTGQAIRAIAMFMPVAIWIIAYIAWFVALVDLLVSAPFWALAHASPEGSGFASAKAAPGYARLLSAVLRPFLMVAGAVLAVAIWRIAGGGIASLVMAATSLSAENSPWDSRMFSALAISLIFLAVYVWIFHMLVWSMPRKAPLWIGGILAAGLPHDGGGDVPAPAAAAGGGSGAGGAGGGGGAASAREKATERRPAPGNTGIGQITENDD